MPFTIVLSECTFAKPCPYFISVQLDGSKRLRTEVSSATTTPVFDKAFRDTDFEPSVNSAEHQLTVEAFVVLQQEPQLLGSSTVTFVEPGVFNVTLIRRRGTDSEIPVGRLRIDVTAGGDESVQFVVFAWHAQIDADQPSLRLSCAVHQDDAACAAATRIATRSPPEWHERLTIETKRSWLARGVLRIQVQEATDDSKAIAWVEIPLKHVVPYNAYSLELECAPCDDRFPRASIFVTLGLLDQAFPHAARLAVGQLSLKLAAPRDEARLVALVQLVDRQFVDVAARTWIQEQTAPPPFPMEKCSIHDEGASSLPLNDRLEIRSEHSHRKPTRVATSIDGGTFAWNDDLESFPIARPGQVSPHSDVATYPAAVESAVIVVDFYALKSPGTEPEFLGYCMCPVPSDLSDEGVASRMPVYTIPLERDVAHQAVGECCLHVAVVSNDASGEQSSPRAALETYRAKRRPELVTETAWESIDESVRDR